MKKVMNIKTLQLNDFIESLDPVEMAHLKGGNYFSQFVDQHDVAMKCPPPTTDDFG